MRNVSELMGCIVQRKEEGIVLVDISVKSVQWGSPYSDRRDEYWIERLSTLNLIIHNTGGMPTVVRGNSQTYIDVTCSS